MTEYDMSVFHAPGLLADGDLQLVLRECSLNQTPGNLGPVYRFDMMLAGVSERIGDISLRITTDERIIWHAGHIEFGVEPLYRGHRYAARACTLLKPLARKHGLDDLWLTVTPDNVASRRTCEVLGAEMVEIVDLPEDCDLYARGERQACRYRLRL